MHRRIRRALVMLSIVAALLVYQHFATESAQRAIAAQTPAVATAADVARYVDGAQLIRDVRTLSAHAFEGRRTGSPGGVRARHWIVEQLTALGVTAAGTAGYTQPFSFTHRSIRGLVMPGRPFETVYSNAANVLARVDGTVPDAQWIVLSAHYDHLGVRQGQVHPGADDNASGVAVLLAAARHFSRQPLKHTLVLAAFDAEELGLRGAEAFVASDPRIVARTALNVNLDMVSRSDRNEIFAAGTYQSPWALPILQHVQRRAAVRILFGHDRPIHRAGSVDDWTTQSDHGVFHEAGVPFVYFGVEDHADYHQPTDTADKIDPRFFRDAADMILEAVRTFDERIGK